MSYGSYSYGSVNYGGGIVLIQTIIKTFIIDGIVKVLVTKIFTVDSSIIDKRTGAGFKGIGRLGYATKEDRVSIYDSSLEKFKLL